MLVDHFRIGDPETQTLLIFDADLSEIMVVCTKGWLEPVSINVDSQFSATVVGTLDLV